MNGGGRRVGLQVGRGHLAAAAGNAGSDARAHILPVGLAQREPAGGGGGDWRGRRGRGRGRGGGQDGGPPMRSARLASARPLPASLHYYTLHCNLFPMQLGYPGPPYFQSLTHCVHIT